MTTIPVNKNNCFILNFAPKHKMCVFSQVLRDKILGELRLLHFRPFNVNTCRLHLCAVRETQLQAASRHFAIKFNPCKTPATPIWVSSGKHAHFGHHAMLEYSQHTTAALPSTLLPPAAPPRAPRRAPLAAGSANTSTIASVRVNSDPVTPKKVGVRHSVGR